MATRKKKNGSRNKKNGTYQHKHQPPAPKAEEVVRGGAVGVLSQLLPRGPYPPVRQIRASYTLDDATGFEVRRTKPIKPTSLRFALGVSAGAIAAYALFMVGIVKWVTLAH